MVSERVGRAVRLPKAEVTLKSEGGRGSEVMQSMKLSIVEATQIFQSIQRTYDLHEIVEIKVGELSWTTFRDKGSSEALALRYLNERV